MDRIVEDEKSICSSLSVNRGMEFKSKIKTQKKLSFTPTQASDFKEKNKGELNKTSRSAFDSAVNANEANESEMTKSVHSSQFGTHSTRSTSNLKSESFIIFEEEFSELIESLRRFSRTKTVQVSEKKKGHLCEGGQDLCNDLPLKENALDEQRKDLKKEDFEKMTNIQEINNFNEYTNDCIKLIAKMTMPDFETLENRFVNLPFANDIGLNKKRLAVFDLDETLIHCELKDIYSAQQIIDVVISSTMRKTVGLNVRPNMKEELMRLKEKYHLIVYTASQQKYADAVLDTIDPDHSIFSHRLYRNNCTLVNVEEQQLYIKDLRIFKGISLKDIVIIDNSVLSFGFHLSNGVPILPYYKATDDKELKNLRKFLDRLACVSDIPGKLRSLMKLEENVAKCRDEEEFELDTIEELDNSYASLDNSVSNSSSSCK